MRLFLILAFFATGALPASGALVLETFQVDTGSGLPFGTEFSRTNSLSDGAGVTFDATLTVLGSGTLTQASTGLGISGGGSELVNDGEHLTFSMAISNVSGGTVVFDGFTQIDTNGATSGGDTLIFSLDNNEFTPGDNFLTVVDPGDVDLSAFSPSVFTVIAQSGALNSFRIDDITGTFSTSLVATPVPTSGTLLTMILGGCSLLLCKRFHSLLPNGRPELARF